MTTVVVAGAAASGLILINPACERIGGIAAGNVSRSIVGAPGVLHEGLNLCHTVREARNRSGVEESRHTLEEDLLVATLCTSADGLQQRRCGRIESGGERLLEVCDRHVERILEQRCRTREAAVCDRVESGIAPCLEVLVL